MEYVVLFLLGISVGSFLNVVIYRLKRGESAMKGRSHCDHCRAKINWFDNIPLLSYLFLRGKCRKCQRKIPIEYFLTELTVGLEFVWIYWLLTVNFHFFGSWEGFYSLALLIYWLILFSGSLAIAYFDQKYLLIPDQIVWVLIGASVIRLFFSHQWQVLIVGLLSAGFIWLIRFLSKGKMGDGDIVLALLMGIVLGWPNIIIAYYIAFLTGASVGVILILVRKKKFKDRIAFGPFLLLGMLVAKLWGEQIWQWYQKALLF